MSQGMPPEQDPAGSVFTQNIDARGGQVNAVLGGDQYNYIYRGQPPYRVEPFDPLGGTLPPSGPGRVPSRLLAARYQVVPFYLRPELADLESWRDNASADFSVRLLHAEGGAGKTRLAMQFAVSSAEANWAVAVARHRSEVASAGGPDESVTVRAPGLVILVDYADRWPLADLMALVRQHRDAARDHLRILLLGRPAGVWWQGVMHQLAKLDIFDAATLPLKDLPDDPDVRTGMYRQARDSFASIYGIRETGRIPVPADLADRAFALPLTIHMRALVDVDATGRGHEPPARRGQAQLSSYLLDREHDYWRSAHDLGHGPVGTTPQTLGRAVYVATLTGAAERTAAAAALTRTAVAADPQAGALILADHARCYPPETPGLMLEPLRPDRLGEDFLALTLPGREAEFTYYATDPWASSASARLLTSTSADDGQAPPYARPALSTLIEAARRWPHVATDVLGPLLRGHPALALAAGGAALTRLASLTALDPDVLQGIEDQLPDGPDIDLDPGIAVLTERLVRHRLTAEPDLATRARLHAILGWRFGCAGLNAQALDPAGTAVVLYRQLAREDPARQLPGLAAALDNVGIIRTNLGQWDDALESTREATAIRRDLARADRDAHLPDLAISLNNLANRYWNLDRFAEGLDPAREAREIFGRLAETDPAGYLPDLAMAQHNLGNLLAGVGQRREALGLAEQSLTTYRQLAQSAPSAYLPDLALALNSVADLRAGTGQPGDALEPAWQAEAIYRQLAEMNPAAFWPRLAMAVNNLGTLLGELGRPADALPLAEEAVSIYRKLAAASPAAFRPDLAMALNNLGTRLGALGRQKEALATTLAAVSLYDELATARPDAHRRGQAAALLNAAVDHASLGQGPESLPLAERAAGLYALLADEDPAAFLPHQSAALGNLGSSLADVGRYAEALESTALSVAIGRELAEADPGAHLADLARALLGFAVVRVNGMAELENALDAVEEAVGIYELFAEGLPDAFSRFLLDAQTARAAIQDALARGDADRTIQK